jgi:hypothetical protein
MTPLKTAQAIAALVEDGANVVISTTAPQDPAEGDLWFDSTTLDLYIYYDDGDSTQWVGVGGGNGDISTLFSAGVIETNNDEELKFWRGTQAEFDAIELDPKTYVSETFDNSKIDIAVDTGIEYIPIPLDNNFNSNFESYLQNIKLFIRFEGESEDLLFYDGSQQTEQNNFEEVIDATWDNLSAFFGSGPDLSFNGEWEDSTYILDLTLWFGTNPETFAQEEKLFLIMYGLNKEYTIRIDYAELDKSIEYLITGKPVKATVDYFKIDLFDFDWSGSEPATAVMFVPGILESDRPLIDIDFTDVPFTDIEDIEAEYAKIYRVKATDDDEITFYAKEALSKDLAINIKVVR